MKLSWMSYRLLNRLLSTVLFAATCVHAQVTQQWAARYNGPGNAEDGANAVAVDGAGNVYVTGQSYGGVVTSYDYATIKYSQP